MKLDEDYKKVMNELQKNFGWSNIDILPESYQDLLNDTIMAVKNLTIQRVSNSVCDCCVPRPEDPFEYDNPICEKCGLPIKQTDC